MARGTDVLGHENLPESTAHTMVNRASARIAKPEPWLLIIDPQVIFADPGSEWGSPMWKGAWPNIEALAKHFAGRIIISRWLPTANRASAWGEYFDMWPFADVPADDPRYDLVPEAAALDAHSVIDEPGFGKWGERLRALVGDTPNLVVAGVATDCCVVSTVLPAADAGAWITVASDACAGSTPENHHKALDVMALFPPQVSVASTRDIIAQAEASATQK